MAGTAEFVRTGPGTLYVAAVGAAEPTDLTTAWDPAWTALGYTAEGHSFTSSPSFDPVEVAELDNPLRYESAGIEYTLEFAAAEVTATNLQRALNGGTVTSATGVTVFEPPAPGTVATRVAIGWQSKDGKERYVWRKCLQTGDVETARRKGADYAQVPMSFMIEQPDGDVRPWIRLADDTAGA